MPKYSVVIADVSEILIIGQNSCAALFLGKTYANSANEKYMIGKKDNETKILHLKFVVILIVFMKNCF